MATVGAEVETGTLLAALQREHPWITRARLTAMLATLTDEGHLERTKHGHYRQVVPTRAPLSFRSATAG